MSKPRIAVVSPFIDKRHGTERAVAECVQRLAGDYDIHVYSTRVEDLNFDKITWHRIPALPGPHLFGYLWWFLANHLWRWWDRRIRGFKPEVVFSPGINCLDADAIYVHVVFGQLREQMKQQLSFRGNPLKTWHRILHRRIYYSLIASLERRIYSSPEVSLIAVSHKSAHDLSRFYSRTSNLRIAYSGLDLGRFNPTSRDALRDNAREELRLARDQFVLLLIGNDWRSKGLPCVLEAAGELRDSNLCVMVVGSDNAAPFESAIEQNGLSGRVRFFPPRPDVEFYYASADVYVSPTLEDAFALPPAEAMACGLPIITSRHNGGAEIVTSGEDGFVLDDPADFLALAQILRRLMMDPELRRRIGEKAVYSARKLTWDDAAAHIRASWEQARLLKSASHLEK
jgi:UDP-glucose:(heptosyl)LPS alpha-1,3-glucosyltransferase